MALRSVKAFPLLGRSSSAKIADNGHTGNAGPPSNTLHWIDMSNSSFAYAGLIFFGRMQSTVHAIHACVVFGADARLSQFT